MVVFFFGIVCYASELSCRFAEVEVFDLQACDKPIMRMSWQV